MAVLLDNFISASARMEAEERVAAAERQSRYSIFEMIFYILYSIY